MKMSAEHNVEMLVVAKLNMNFYNLKTTATQSHCMTDREQNRNYTILQNYTYKTLFTFVPIWLAWLTNITIILNKVDYQNTFSTHTFGWVLFAIIHTITNENVEPFSTKT